MTFWVPIKISYDNIRSQIGFHKIVKVSLDNEIARGLKIIREADEYYLIHQGVIQRHLGSRKGTKRVNGRANTGLEGEGSLQVEESCIGILDKILFFIGDLEVATRDAKRKRIE